MSKRMMEYAQEYRYHRPSPILTPWQEMALWRRRACFFAFLWLVTLVSAVLWSCAR